MIRPASAPDPSPPLSLSAVERAVAYSLRVGDTEAASQLADELIAIAPHEALPHFIHAQLSFSRGAWRELILSARRCWSLGGQVPWIGHMIGGVALRCGHPELGEQLEASLPSLRGEIRALSQLPESELNSLSEALLEPLPPLPKVQSHQRSTSKSQPSQAGARQLPRFRSRTGRAGGGVSPDWIERGAARQSLERLGAAETLEWLDRSATRQSQTTLQSASTPEWMSVGTLEGTADGLGAQLTSGSIGSAIAEGLEAGRALCQELELPQEPLLALPLPAPTLHQAHQEPRRLKGRFLLVGYADMLGLIDLARPKNPWHFKRSELDEIRVEPLVGQWKMSVIFADMRVIEFEVMQGVNGDLQAYEQGGLSFKRWLAQGAP